MHDDLKIALALMMTDLKIGLKNRREIAARELEVCVAHAPECDGSAECVARLRASRTMCRMLDLKIDALQGGLNTIHEGASGYVADAMSKICDAEVQRHEAADEYANLHQDRVRREFQAVLDRASAEAADTAPPPDPESVH